MSLNGIAPHESIELHEILTFKNTCLTKDMTMSLLVSDDELKTILQNDLATTKNHIEQLKGFMKKAYTGDTNAL